jgi:hypothetical protein
MPSDRARPQGGAFDANAFQNDAFDVGPLVFISHNKADKDDAERIGMYLVGDGLGVWYDEWELSAGDSIVGRVDAALGACTHFLIVWSDSANTSRWVREELETALSARITEGRPRVIPIVVDDTPLPPMLAKLQYIKLDDEPSEDRLRIVREITGRAPETTFARALVQLFNEVVYEDKPMGVKWNYCPRCGGDDLHSWGGFDERLGEGVGFTKCNECGYQDVTASW